MLLLQLLKKNDLVKLTIFYYRGIPVYKMGNQVQKQPVYIGDVAAGVVAAVKDHKSAGRTYQFVG